MRVAPTHFPIVGVMGSGSEEHVTLAEPLGRWLATLSVHLLTGGGGGVMTSVSRAFCDVSDRVGCVLGVLPGPDDLGALRPGYPNAWVEIPIQTHLPFSGEQGTDPLSRNHINVLSSDVLVALPGDAGTLSEIELAVRYERPIVLFGEHWHTVENLPDDVPVALTLEQVQRFVTGNLVGRTS